MMFEMMLGDESKDKNMPDHWKSIKKEAEPLVRQLLELNKKMTPSYEVYGYYETGKKSKKKKKLSNDERIDLAREKLWEVEASTLKEGDQVWLHKDYDLPMENLYDDEPVEVEIVKDGRIFVSHPYERHGVYEISSKDKVLKVPADFTGEDDPYLTDEYWLAKADELGI